MDHSNNSGFANLLTSVRGLLSMTRWSFASRVSSPLCRRHTVRRTQTWRCESLESRVLLTVATLTPARDNTLFEDVQGDVSNGAGAFLYVGATGATAGDALRRAVLAFDIAGTIPAGSTINSVTLTLHLSKNPPASGAQTLDLHSLLADWGQGTSDADGTTSSSPGGQGAAATTNDATWLDRFFGSAPATHWTTAGGDFQAEASASSSVNGVGNYSWTSATLASEVQGWLDNPASNFGWILVNSNEAATATGRRFDSRENTTAANRPKLVIDYTAPPPPPTVSVDVAPVNVAEDGGQGLVYTFTRASGTDPITVNFSVSGTAVLDTDYSATGATQFTSTTGSVEIGANQTTATVTITPSVDTTVEPDETVILTVTSGTGYTPDALSATGTIQNDDASVSIVVDTGSQPEGDSGLTTFTFTVTRTGLTSGTATVDYVVSGTVSDTADANDFGSSFPTGTVTFSPGTVTQSVTVNVSGDTAVEPDEGFVVTLQSPSTGLTIGASSATAIIENDEAVLNLAGSTVAENQNAGTVVGTLSTSLAGVGNSPTFSLVSGSGDAGNGDFAIVGNQLQTAQSLNFEEQPTTTIRVRVDGNGFSAEHVFTITVTDVNDFPELTPGTTPVSFRKKSPPISLFPNVQVHDQDASPGFALGGGELVLILSAATNKKGSKSLDTVTLGGLSTIGTLSSQQVSLNSLRIEINLLPGATSAQLQTFLRGITFSTKGGGLKKATRNVSLALTDNAVATTPLSQTVNVSVK